MAKKNRATDAEIKAALRAGKTQAVIISELKTHSQRIMNLKVEMGMKEAVKYVNRLTDCFVMNAY